MKFFFIKSTYKRVEEMYWLGNAGADEKIYLPKDKDCGTNVLNLNKINFYSEFFRKNDQIDQFPQGISTLSDDDNLNQTYLKIFLVKNLTNYNLHYKHLFDSITKDQRIQALNKLQNITRYHLELLLTKIPEDWMAQDRKNEILDYLENRINEFKNKFKQYIVEESNPEKSTTQSSNYFFQKLLSQKSVVKSNWEQKYTLDTNYSDEGDWSQSGAGHNRYTKK